MDQAPVPINHDWLGHRVCEEIGGNRFELVPFRQYEAAICTFQAVSNPFRVSYPLAEDNLSILHRGRVIDAYSHSGRQQRPDDLHGGSFAHVAGSGLKGQAEHSCPFPLQVANQLPCQTNCPRRLKLVR